MSMKDILGKRMTCTFEVSPPKTDVGMAQLCGEGGVLQQLYTLQPDGIACTYGTGGADAGKNLEVLDRIVRDGKTTAVTHFTCLGSTRDGIRRHLQTYLDHGVDHILALRGELSPGRKDIGEVQDSAQLVQLIRKEFGSGFTIAVAGSPEGRRSMEEDIAALKRKRDNGADYILTRLCWDMERFYRWLDAVLAADIRMPIAVSVMPVVDQAATIQTALASNGSGLPEALAQIISQNWILPNPFVRDPFDAEAERKRADFKAAGMEYTVNQIRAYRACGINGIHLLTGNHFGDVARIAKEAGLRES